ncbi:MAG TPA: hypothetical protein VFH45_12875, partial [Acidimicrobiales bacterium]|nr:hypothetical protein [Acidimicrobiales bacterium]
MARYVVRGTGAVGARAARQIFSGARTAEATAPPAATAATSATSATSAATGAPAPAVESMVVVGGRRSAEVVSALGPPASAAGWEEALAGGPAVVVLAHAGAHAEAATQALEAGAHVVSVTDDEGDVRALLDLEEAASAKGLSVVVGAGFSPGLSCVLARHAAAWFEGIDEVRVASSGTGGPACARQHHRSLAARATEWQGGWSASPGGSGRELCWFPAPVGAADCYRAGLV